MSENIQSEVPEVAIGGKPKKRPKPKTSKTWNEFTVMLDNNGEVKGAQCNHCKLPFSYKKGGGGGATSHLTRHLGTCVPHGVAKNVKGKGPKQGLLAFEFGEGNLTAYRYDKDKVKDILAKAIIAHEYPFMMVEHDMFVLFCKALNPRFDPVFRKPIRDYCLKVYEVEKEKLRSTFASIGKIGLTSDLWTSNQTVGYMCLTCHFIDSEWKLQKRVLNFCCLPPPHTRVNIADGIFTCLSEWGIGDKVSSITLDNASANDAAVTCLKESFGDRLYFSGKVFHVRFCAHILNLMVQDGLKQIKKVVENVSETVKYVTMTPLRLHKFDEIVKQLKLPSSQGLTLDVPTRWNSTYYMLRSALIFKDVFPRYKERDPHYDYLPSEEEWKRASDVCQFLEIFDDATLAFSGQCYPTSNLFFPEIWKVREILDVMSLDSREWMICMVTAMKEKFDKYWKECSLLMAIGTALDPRNKLKYIEFIFKKIYLEQEAKDELEVVRKALVALYEDYVFKEESTTNNVSNESGVGGSRSSGKAKSRDEFETWATENNSTQSLLKSEIDVYLDKGIYVGDDGQHIDILDWWKANTLKFRILSKMARDILSIPVTSVASESAFSAAKRVIDDHRSSLNEDTIEGLICTGYWLRTEFGIGKSNGH